MSNHKDDLLPCPFCGSANLRSGGDDKFVGFWCLDCEAQGPNHYGRHEWNTRAEAAEAKVEELRSRAEAAEAKLQEAVDLIAGDKVGGEWKRACYDFLKSARAILAEIGEKP